METQTDQNQGAIEKIRETLKTQILAAVEAGDFDQVQRLTSKAKRLDIALKEIRAIADESSGAPTALSSAASAASVRSAFVRISGGDLRRNLFRTTDAKGQGMRLVEDSDVTIDLVGPNGTRTIRTLVMSYKFRARREFGKYYKDLRLSADERLLLEEIGTDHFRITKP